MHIVERICPCQLSEEEAKIDYAFIVVVIN